MKRPWMPLWVADYRAKTAHLNAQQHGGYLLLIMHYWATGALPQDDESLSRISCMTRREWKRNRPVLSSFFKPDWTQDRVSEEIAKAVDISKKRRSAAVQMHSKRTANGHAFAEQLDTYECEGESGSIRSKEDDEERSRWWEDGA